MTLRASLNIERPLDREEPAFVIEPPDPALVEEFSGLLIGENRAVLPSIPKTAHDVDELFRDLVAVVMLLDAILIEVQRRRIARAGHHVPGGTAAADIVDRRE